LSRIVTRFQESQEKTVLAFEIIGAIGTFLFLAALVREEPDARR